MTNSYFLLALILADKGPRLYEILAMGQVIGYGCAGRADVSD